MEPGAQQAAPTKCKCPAMVPNEDAITRAFRSNDLTVCNFSQERKRFFH